MTCAMEFGVSPTLASRKQMVERGDLFGVPGHRWLPARSICVSNITRLLPWRTNPRSR